ncbi:c-type cytochrome [Terrimonas sp. NA20]|uniref:C-type cytochrome n=1 Tax=Terrimonas ginsenosidimutans TaxID=2908004 RepID=A0ABS9KS49_9BACT|nr:c-type cytochrome [Terrimonas ginsenosidimutans]MCG2615157.1 c-type cytochrome [Terrimonas ginsenosidimutans]
MKEIILMICCAALLLACGNKITSKRMPASQRVITENKAQGNITDHPDYNTGIQLVRQSDCFTCHKISEAFVAPSFTEVANKYRSYSDSIVRHLAGRVITGGSGVWGILPMTPHADLSKDDAAAMIRYILLLKQ